MSVNNGKTVKLVTDSTEMVIDDIEEYVCGFSYFYVRYTNGDTSSFDRRHIRRALRKLPTGDYRPIHLKKPKMREDGTYSDE